VYEHRPTAYHIYDCRYTNFNGTTLSYEGYEEPRWLFDIESRADDIIAASRLQIVKETSRMADKLDGAELSQYAAHHMTQLGPKQFPLQVPLVQRRRGNFGRVYGRRCNGGGAANGTDLQVWELFRSVQPS
jgi:hypothetical protein